MSHAHLRRHHWLVVWLNRALVVVLLNHFMKLYELGRVSEPGRLLHWVWPDFLGWITNIAIGFFMFSSSSDVLLDIL